MFPAVFNLTQLNGSNGFAINGMNYNDLSGSSISSAGDINGDGIADIIINAPTVNGYAGQSYVIFGNKNGFPVSFNLADLNGDNGFVINGIRPSNHNYITVNPVSSAGDVNGDGITDIIIGADGANNNVGQSYIIFGSKNGFPASFNLADLNGNNGFAVNGINQLDFSGSSVSGAGDVNGDGIADIIIGADGANNNAGQSYVIFGNKTGLITPFNLSILNGQNGFAINGINGWSGTSVSSAGDINSDGVADILIGAPSSYNTGQSYVIFGSKNGFNTPFNLFNLNGQNGFAINGINSGDGSGNSVSSAGDVNGDGIADIIVGAYYVNKGVGQSYIIFGSKNGFPGSFNLADLNGDNGFAINGINSGDQSGYSVSSAGDVNGDGIADIIIGAYYANNRAGQSYVIFGNKAGFTTPFNLSGLNGQNGFAINGINLFDESGYSVSGVGDVNDDGIADIIIGAPGASDSEGQSYVVFGQNSTSIVGAATEIVEV